MSRIDELTQLAIEGALSADEESELDSLLTSSDEARRRYHDLIDVEIALRGFDDRLDVSESVMARLEGRSTPRLELVPATKSAELVAEDSIDGKVDRWMLRLMIPATLAAAVVLVFALIHNRERFDAPAFTANGEVAVVREGKPVSGFGKRSLQAGDRLVVSEEASTQLAYDDSTKIDLSGGTELRLKPVTERGGGGSKSLELIAGTLTAEVSAQPEDQPLVVKTPHAEAVVRGTRFALRSGSDRTRLEVTEGRVDFFVKGIDEPAVVNAGSFVEAGENFAEGETAPVPVVRPLRSEKGLLALYTFKEGSGDVVRDLASWGDPLDLYLTGEEVKPLQWLPGGGIRFTGDGFLASREAARKIIKRCRASDEFTVEAWVEPAVDAMGPSRVVTLSLASAKVNFMLGQGTIEGDPRKKFIARINSEFPVGNFPAPDGSAAGGLTHLVLTRGENGREQIWINGDSVAQRQTRDSLDRWYDSLPLAIGNDPGGEDRPWRGACFFVAIYDRALAAEELEANYLWGVP